MRRRRRSGLVWPNFSWLGRSSQLNQSRSLSAGPVGSPTPLRAGCMHPQPCQRGQFPKIGVESRGPASWSLEKPAPSRLRKFPLRTNMAGPSARKCTGRSSFWGEQLAYSKPYLPIPDQLKLIESRGMVVSDDALAQSYLNKIAYYRLSGYWYPYRQAPNIRRFSAQHKI